MALGRGGGHHPVALGGQLPAHVAQGTSQPAISGRADGLSTLVTSVVVNGQRRVLFL
jgi:hypothetical protein